MQITADNLHVRIGELVESVNISKLCDCCYREEFCYRLHLARGLVTREYFGYRFCYQEEIWLQGELATPVTRIVSLYRVVTKRELDYTLCYWGDRLRFGRLCY